MAGLGGYESHRGQEFNHHMLPRCQPLIEAIAHRMAYEAAKNGGVHPKVLCLFEQLCIETDLSWYVEKGLFTRSDFLDSMTEAYNAALPVLLHGRQRLETGDYITAPIMTSKAWEEFFSGLPEFGVAGIKLKDGRSKL